MHFPITNVEQMTLCLCCTVDEIVILPSEKCIKLSGGIGDERAQ